MNLVKISTTLLTGIILTGATLPITQVHADNNSMQTTVTNNNQSSESLDGNMQ